jgi:hypothetical protein
MEPLSAGYSVKLTRWERVETDLLDLAAWFAPALPPPWQKPLGPLALLRVLKSNPLEANSD